MNIRGVTSINGGGPLVLVDNVPMDLDLVDPNDIESVSVLKMLLHLLFTVLVLLLVLFW